MHARVKKGGHLDFYKFLTPAQILPSPYEDFVSKMDTLKKGSEQHSLDRKAQFPLQILIILIRRQIQPIKARMAPGRPTWISTPVDP